MGMVRESFSTTYFGSTWSHKTKKKLTHQPKELVNQNSDTDEWKRRGKLLIIF